MNPALSTCTYVVSWLGHGEVLYSAPRAKIPSRNYRDIIADTEVAIIMCSYSNYNYYENRIYQVGDL